MKRMTLSGSVSVLFLLAGLTALPAAAATPQPVSATPASAEAEKAAAPYLIKVGETDCPVIPRGSSLSPKTQRLFETLTSACLMKASGIMTDTEFQGIRDQIVGMLSMQISNEMAEDATVSAQPLASNP